MIEWKEWKEIILELVKKLTAPLAFAVLFVVVVALVGERIPLAFQALIYIVTIYVMVIYSLPIFQKMIAGKKTESEEQPPERTIVLSDNEGENDVSRETKPVRPKKLSIQAARDNYLEALIRDCSPMRLVGLDPNAADPVRGGLSLEKVYIALDTTTPIQKEPENESSGGERKDVFLNLEGEKTLPLTALEALVRSEERHIVLLGLPGTGKSTFVRYLTLRMCQALYHGAHNLTEKLPGWQGKPLLPVIIPLGLMAEGLPESIEKGDAKLVEDFLQKMLSDDPRMKAFSEHILDYIKQEGCLFLFDGLDEVGNMDLRSLIIQAIETFVSRYSRQQDNRFLVTCRTYSYYHDKDCQITGWPTYELALLDQPKIRQFVTAWYDEHIRLEPARQPLYEQKKEDLLTSLYPSDRRRLFEIAPFPIILTMMAVVHTHYGELPDTRAQVYERCTDLLLVRWDLERAVLPGKVQKQNIVDALGVRRGRLDAALRKVAFKAHKGWTDRNQEEARKGSTALVTEDLLSRVMQVYLGNYDKVKIFLDYCQSANGLLMLLGTFRKKGVPRDAPPRRVYTFPHLTFQEYLAGRYLDGANVGPRVRELLDSSDRWREVVMLLGEYLCFERHDNDRMMSILRALAPDPLPDPIQEKDWHALWMAGDLLLLYNRIFVEQYHGQDHIIDGLRRLINVEALALRERAAVADTLDELGYLPPDLHTFILIPPNTNHVIRNTFYISKYPVTNAQYKRFVESKHYLDKDLWQGFPKFDQNSICMAEDWGDAGLNWLEKLPSYREKDASGMLYPQYWHDPRFGVYRRGVPVVGVSWYEANAFCKWLQRHWNDPDLGYAADNPDLDIEKMIIRLPKETEWVAAAGGKDPEDRFPWDEDGKTTSEESEILRRANVGGNDINRTTPVGMYPLGASHPHDVMDMGGNVFEWQANFYDEDQRYLPLRGGSWLIDRWYARLSVRVPARTIPTDLGFGW